MKKWTGWKRVGWGERSGPGGKEWAGWEGVGRGGRSGPGGKESAGADWLVVRYISLLQDFLFDFFKKPFQETETFHLTEAL